MCRICNSNENYVSNICRVCFDKYPATFDKNNEIHKILYVKNCEKHGIYLTTNARKQCLQCKEEIIFIKKHTCSICKKFVENRDQNGRGYECGCHDKWFKNHMKNIHLNNLKPGKCKICGKFSEKRLSSGIGIDCGCSLEISRKGGLSSKENNTQAGLCTICGVYSNKRNITGMCPTCLKNHNNKNSKNNKNSGNCTICGEYNIKRNINGMGFECGCAKTQYMKNLKSIQNFLNKNNELYFYDKTIKNYVKWNFFKEKFYDNHFNKKDNFLIDMGFNYKYSIFHTFITKDSQYNCGHAAFDKLLIENNINYFVYIKFYKNKNSKILPLVVGESGSLNVNKTGCDLSFSKNPNHGPSRRFLIEENLDYYYEKILVIPTTSKEESLIIENEISNKYNLFRS